VISSSASDNARREGFSYAAGTPTNIVISPILPNNQGFVSNYKPAPPLTTSTAVPTGFWKTTGAQITFPAGSALNPQITSNGFDRFPRFSPGSQGAETGSEIAVAVQ
jgi:hypothetical protein